MSQVLDWEPRIALLDGLKSTVEFFRDEIEHNKNVDGSGTDVAGDNGGAGRASYNPASKIDKWTMRPDDE